MLDHAGGIIIITKWLQYDVCDVTLTLSVYPHRASLKNMPDHGENRTCRSEQNL
jgi:hypothetical protein